MSTRPSDREARAEPSWREIRAGSHRIRWRHDGEDHANPLSGYEVEHRVDGATDWRPVRNRNSLDWFALGKMAAAGAELTRLSGKSPTIEAVVFATKGQAMIEAPAYCVQCRVTIDSPTTGTTGDTCPFCGGRMRTVEAPTSALQEAE